MVHWMFESLNWMDRSGDTRLDVDLRVCGFAASRSFHLEALRLPVTVAHVDYENEVRGASIDIHARGFDDATPAEDFNAEEWCDLHGRWREIALR